MNRISCTKFWVLATLLATVLAANVISPQVSHSLPSVQPAGEKQEFTPSKQSIQVTISNHIVVTSVVQEMINESDCDLPCNLTLHLPKDARLTKLMAFVDGKTYISSIRSFNQARREVARARASRKAAGLAEEVETETGKQVNITLSQVKPSQQFTFSFCYMQEAEYSNGVFSYAFSVDKSNKQVLVAKRVEFAVGFDCSVTPLDIQTSHPYELNATSDMKKMLYFGNIAEGDGNFKISWKLDLKPGVPALLRGVDSKGLPYLSLLMIPRSEEVIDVPRNYTFLIDRSGSMHGEKFKYAVEALNMFIDNLKSTDRFNICFFSHSEAWVEERYQFATDDNKARAHEKIAKYEISGGTDIYRPVLTAFTNMSSLKDGKPTVVLLTDGQSSFDWSGFEMALNWSKSVIPVYTFGVGDPNEALLREISRKTGTQYVYATKAEEVKTAFANISKQLASVVGMGFQSSNESLSIIPSRIANVFSGDLIKLYGRLEASLGSIVFTMTDSQGEWKYELASGEYKNLTKCSFLGKQWGSRKILALLDRLELSYRDETMLEIIALSKEFLLITPFTSLVFSELGLENERKEKEKKAEEKRKREEAKEAEKAKEGNGDVDKQDSQNKSKNHDDLKLEGEDEEEVEEEEEIEETDFEDEVEEDEAIEGDPDSPSDQPYSDDTLGAIGIGAGSSSGPYESRRGGRRRAAAKKKGGSGITEASVDSGLKWLADHQEPDGHWDTTKWGGKTENDPGMCGLALLAFAGAGHTERNGKYRRHVQKAIKWLSEHQTQEGSFAPKGNMYNHAIPTLALMEEVAMAPIARTKAIAKKALDYMLKMQNQYKGWGNRAGDKDNNTSITTWCTMVLKAAKVAKFDIPTDAWAGVTKFLDEVTETNYGQVGYNTKPVKGAEQNGYYRYSMTACGILSRLYLGVPREDRIIRMGVEILMQNLPEWNQPGMQTPFFNYWYFGSLVMFQIDGNKWEKWNKKVREMLVQHQNTEKGDLEGSWEPPKNTYGIEGGRIYSTAMAVLTLEVYYRYEIIANCSVSKSK